MINNFKIPVVTGWNAQDLVPKNNRYNCGKPRTVGDRSGNFAIKNCDLLIVLGCRLNIRQLSYNWKSFARDAKIIMVDIDKSEFKGILYTVIALEPTYVSCFCIPLFEVHKSNTEPRYSSGTIMVALIQGSSIELIFTGSGKEVGL